MTTKPHIQRRGAFWFCKLADHDSISGEYVGTTPARAYAFWFEAVGVWINIARNFISASERMQ